jgi:hypothetical protein
MKTLTRKPRMHRMPSIGDKVTPIGKGGMPGYPNGTVGRVVDIIAGSCGPIVAVRFDGYGVVDLFWKKIRKV